MRVVLPAPFGPRSPMISPLLLDPQTEILGGHVVRSATDSLVNLSKVFDDQRILVVICLV